PGPAQCLARSDTGTECRRGSHPSPAKSRIAPSDHDDDPADSRVPGRVVRRGASRSAGSRSPASGTHQHSVQWHDFSPATLIGSIEAEKYRPTWHNLEGTPTNKKTHAPHSGRIGRAAGMSTWQGNPGSINRATRSCGQRAGYSPWS